MGKLVTQHRLTAVALRTAIATIGTMVFRSAPKTIKAEGGGTSRTDQLDTG